MSGRMDNVEYVEDFAARIVRRAGVRISAAYEGQDLAALARLKDDVDRALVIAVRGMRQQGCTWRVIGEELGMTRQSAQERYAARVSGDGRHLSSVTLGA